MEEEETGCTVVCIYFVFAIVGGTESKPGFHINCSFIRKQIQQSRTESKIQLY